MINIFKIFVRYFEELLNEDEKKLLLQTSKECENIEFNKIDKDKLRCFNIKNFCGSKNMLKFAIDKRNKNRYIINKETMNYLWNVEMFKYIKKRYKDAKFTPRTFAYTALNGKLEDIKWLKENGCSWDEWTFAFAALNGNLENMKWLKENGFSWDTNTFMYAAKNGNLENMKWLKENECPWNKYTFAGATENGNLENMEWLIENGCSTEPVHTCICS